MHRLLLIATIGVQLVACGDDSETGDSSSGEGAAGNVGGEGGGDPGTGTGVAVGCDNFDNWTCQTQGSQCWAYCQGDKGGELACGSDGCWAQTGPSSSGRCEQVKPEKLLECGDCRAAFDLGCR